MPLTIAILTKISWNIKLQTYGTSKSFSGSIRIVDYVRMFFIHDDTSWRQIAVDNARQQFFKDIIPIHGTSISYFVILILFIGYVAVAGFYIKSKQGENKQRVFLIVNLSIIVQAILYAFSIGAIYISRFVEYEAVNLASYDRYMNMAFMPLWCVSILYILNMCNILRTNDRLLSSLAICFVLALSPVDQLTRCFHRDYVRASENGYVLYSDFCKKITDTCKEDEKVYLIAQGDHGYDTERIRYYCLPIRVGGLISIGNSIDDLDKLWTKEIGIDELRTDLVENYDYLALYRTNDYFTSNYRELFAEGSIAFGLIEVRVCPSVILDRDC